MNTQQKTTKKQARLATQQPENPFTKYWDTTAGKMVVASNKTGWKRYEDGSESYPYGPGIGGWRGF